MNHLAKNRLITNLTSFLKPQIATHSQTPNYTGHSSSMATLYPLLVSPKASGFLSWLRKAPEFLLRLPQGFQHHCPKQEEPEKKTCWDAVAEIRGGGMVAVKAAGGHSLDIFKRKEYGLITGVPREEPRRGAVSKLGNWVGMDAANKN